MFYFCSLPDIKPVVPASESQTAAAHAVDCMCCRSRSMNGVQQTEIKRREDWLAVAQSLSTPAESSEKTRLS